MVKFSNEFTFTRALAKIIRENLDKTPMEIAHLILKYEDSKGVVIKVKCPDCAWSQFGGEDTAGMTPCHTCNSTGYIFEPLIKE